MFKLHKTSRPAAAAAKSPAQERIDFKFSSFKALQVPKGWDRLVVSMVSVETGKTISKSSKAFVKNGCCQWGETLSQSIGAPHDESSKELDVDCNLKFIVAMGSARSGILGETTVSLASFMSSNTSVQYSFPLKKCNYGTTLQAKVQCLSPRLKLSYNESKDKNSQKEIKEEDTHDSELKSDTSVAKIEESFYSIDLSSITHQEQHGKKEPDSSSSGSHGNYASAECSIIGENLSYASAECSIIGENLSSSTNLGGEEHNHISPPQSNHSSFKSRITYPDNLSQDDPEEFAAAAPSLITSGSSKTMLEAAEETIEDLSSEAKLWERNARKLMVDLEILRKEFSEQSKANANLDMELLAACAERDALQKLLLEESKVKPVAMEGSTFQDENAVRRVKELENDVKFQEQSNADLNLQLKRCQESNAELVSVLQELEGTIEKLRVEIENLSGLQSKFIGMEKSLQETLEKNRNLMIQTQELQESERNLQAKVQVLAQALEEKNQDIEIVSLNKQALLGTEAEYKQKLLAKEREIVSLKAKLSISLKEMESLHGDGGFLIKEIEELKSKLQELENDCEELTDENLELLIKLKDAKISAVERPEESNEGSQMNNCEEKLKKKFQEEIDIDYKLAIEELESLRLEQEIKLTEFEACLLSKDDEIGNFQSYQQELEAKLSILEKEKCQLEENLKVVIGENDISAKCLNDMRKDLAVLSSSVDSHVSANKMLERKASELESAKQELELHLSDLKQENEELSAYVSSLEAQVKYLTEEKESGGVEFEKSKSQVDSLEGEIARLKNETGAEIMEMKEKLKQLHNHWSDAQGQCEYLERENSKLQTIAQSVTEECSSLQKSNGECNRKKAELHDHVTQLEEKLRESHRNFTDCSKRVRILEENISSMLEDSTSKEKSFDSELEILLEENHMQNKRINLLNQVYAAKMDEIEHLQREIRELTTKMSIIQNERDRIAMEAFEEVSSLHAAISKLDSELYTTRMESEANVQGLMDELAASKRKEEMLKADNGRTSKLLANSRSGEENFKTTLNSLELKLTVTEYEKQRVIEECADLKTQLLKIGALEDEISALKGQLNATKSERKKLESSMHQISGECKELKRDNNSLIERITSLQKAMSELEECKHEKNLVEEKLLRMEGDLMAKEAFCGQYAEVNSELSRIKRLNKQLQRQVQQLEDEKKMCVTRAQSLEQQLTLMKEEQNSHEGDNRSKIPDGVDPVSKIRSLEDELAKCKEANNAYKLQLKRLKPEGRKSFVGSPRRPSVDGEMVPKERFERTKSSLESELKEIRERYLDISLKYAEVEGEREELVMKLREVTDGKLWHK